MRKRLVGVLVAGLVVAGCGTSGGSSGGDQGAPPQEPAPKPAESARKAPAKATEIADKCGILTQQQQQQLGFTKLPEPDNSNGNDGCQYQAGELGHPGWNGFVAVTEKSSFSKEVAKRKSSVTKQAEIAGYPVAEFKSSTGCVLYADVADKGYLLVNLGENSATRSGLELCQQAEKVTEAALQNVPNA